MSQVSITGRRSPRLLSSQTGAITRDVAVQTDVVDDVEPVACEYYRLRRHTRTSVLNRPFTLAFTYSLEVENEVLKAKITRLELVHEALEMHMEDIRSVVNRHDVVLDPFESSQTAIVLSPPRQHAGSLYVAISFGSFILTRRPRGMPTQSGSSRLEPNTLKREGSPVHEYQGKRWRNA